MPTPKSSDSQYYSHGGRDYCVVRAADSAVSKAAFSVVVIEDEPGIFHPLLVELVQKHDCKLAMTAPFSDATRKLVESGVADFGDSAEPLRVNVDQFDADLLLVFLDLRLDENAGQNFHGLETPAEAGWEFWLQIRQLIQDRLSIVSRYPLNQIQGQATRRMIRTESPNIISISHKEGEVALHPKTHAEMVERVRCFQNRFRCNSLTIDQSAQRYRLTYYQGEDWEITEWFSPNGEDGMSWIYLVHYLLGVWTRHKRPVPLEAVYCYASNGQRTALSDSSRKAPTAPPEPRTPVTRNERSIESQIIRNRTSQKEIVQELLAAKKEVQGINSLVISGIASWVCNPECGIHIEEMVGELRQLEVQPSAVEAALASRSDSLSVAILTEIRGSMRGECQQVIDQLGHFDFRANLAGLLSKLETGMDDAAAFELEGNRMLANMAEPPEHMPENNSELAQMVLDCLPELVERRDRRYRDIRIASTTGRALKNHSKAVVKSSDPRANADRKIADSIRQQFARAQKKYPSRFVGRLWERDYIALATHFSNSIKCRKSPPSHFLDYNSALEWKVTPLEFPIEYSSNEFTAAARLFAEKGVLVT